MTETHKESLSKYDEVRERRDPLKLEGESKKSILEFGSRYDFIILDQ